MRQTLDILGELVPHERIEVASRTRVLDWTVPQEWSARKAFLIAPDGRRLCDLKENNLHLVNYSVPFRGRLSRADLEGHLHSLPELPDAIPYVTSYYQRRWGFCLPHRERLALPAGNYEVVVDTDLKDGALTIGEAVLPGTSPQEVLISSYTCHPSMANNELSGPLVLAFLYRRLAAWPGRRLTYRFVLLPETIGSITYLALRGRHLMARAIAGYVLTCLGAGEGFVYARSRRGESAADLAAECTLADLAAGRFQVCAFRPDRGADERQYNAPGFNLPVGALMRTPSRSFPEYHTSLDNKDLISFPAMVEAVDACEAICGALEANRRWLNLAPYGEPQLGERGLYGTLGDRKRPVERSALMWLLNYADGDHDLLKISRLSGLSAGVLAQAAHRLEGAGLVRALAEAETGTWPAFTQLDLPAADRDAAA